MGFFFEEYPDATSPLLRCKPRHTYGHGQMWRERLIDPFGILPFKAKVGFPLYLPIFFCWNIPHLCAKWDQCFFLQNQINRRCSVGWTHSGSLYLAFWFSCSIYCLPVYRGVFQVVYIRQKDLGCSGKYETRPRWSASHLEATWKPFLGSVSGYDAALLRGVPSSHEDFSTRNVFINDKGHITGVVDWELHMVKSAVLAAAHPSWNRYDGIADIRYVVFL